MLKSLIIDDEYLERVVLRSLIDEYCNFVQVIDEAEGVEDGFAKINKYKPDLVFLDVQMGDGTGFDLLKKFSHIDFKIIFVTTHEGFAIEAIKYAALDYLLKPLETDSFINAINKLQNVSRMNVLEQQVQLLLEKSNERKKIALPTADGLLFVKIEDILRCESDGSYTNFVLSNGKKILVTRVLKEFADILPSNLFVRIHKSHLINMEYVKQYSNRNGQSVIMENNDEIPVARTRKDSFLELLKGNSY